MAIRDLFRRGRARPDKRPTRAYVLGLDWGTSTSKMVLRDYDDRYSPLGRAYVIQHSHLNHTVRYPSTVVIDGERVYFGRDADDRYKGAQVERRWGSLKMAMLEAHKGAHAEKPVKGLGVSLADLATASIAHLILIGRHEADRLAAGRKARAEVEVMLGMPVTRASDSKGAWYARLAHRARKLADEVGPVAQPYEGLQGVSLGKLGSLLERVDDALPSEPTAPSDFVRPELAAALYWPYQNPETEEGLYTAVDFGAGTTNISYYRLARVATSQGWVRRGQISFYAGQCKSPGCDQIDQAIAEVLRRPDAATLRGRENTLLERHPECRQPVDGVIQKMFGLWSDTRMSAFPKEPRLDEWNDIRLLLVGGGSKIERIREAFRTNPHKSARGVRMMGRLPSPEDLFCMPGPGGGPSQFDGDHEMLYVAYGLSIRPGDFAKIHPSDTVEPLERSPMPRHDVEPEELGYSDK